MMNNIVRAVGAGLAVSSFVLLSSALVGAENKTILIGEQKIVTEDGMTQEEGRLLSASLGLNFSHTDNLFGDSINEVSDWKTRLKPTLTLTYPGAKDGIFVSVDTDTSVAGGMPGYFYVPKGFKRYQAYLKYGADILIHNDHSELDNTTQEGEAFFQYNLRGGLSVNLLGGYKVAGDPVLLVQKNDSEDSYDSNMLSSILDYQITPKVNVRGDIKRYQLTFDDVVSSGKDRVDMLYALSAGYQFTGKTGFFLEYEHVDLAYDLANGLDSQENTVSLGMHWRATGKTKLTGKLGWVTKDFENANLGSVSSMDISLLGDHQITSKSSLQLQVAHGIKETDSIGTDYMKQTKFLGTYTLAMTSQLLAAINVNYVIDTYESQATVVDETEKILTVTPVVRYQFNRRMSLEGRYSYTDKTADTLASEYQKDIFSVALTREIYRWLSVEGSYSYTNNDAALLGADYDENIVSLSFTGRI